MTMAEEKKLRHALARFENVKHCSVEVISAEIISNGKRRVFAKIKGYKHGYLFSTNDTITESWRVV